MNVNPLLTSLLLVLSILGYALAIVLLAALICLVVRKNRYDENHLTQKVKVEA